MSRLHDMGGRFGDGPVAPDFGQEPVFKEEWHGRALALTVASGFCDNGIWTRGGMRENALRQWITPRFHIMKNGLQD